MIRRMTEVASAALREQAEVLGYGLESHGWQFMSWMWLGYDAAATGYSHYIRALQDLWPGRRPCPEALDLFRVGFAWQRRGRPRPSTR